MVTTASPFRSYTPTLSAGLQQAMDNAASRARYFHSKAGGRRYSGDTAMATKYDARSQAFGIALERLEDTAERLGVRLPCRSCTASMDCYHD